MNLDPELFETAVERAIRETGVDKAAFEAALAPRVPAFVSERIAADLARAESLTIIGARAASLKVRS